MFRVPTSVVFLLTKNPTEVGTLNTRLGRRVAAGERCSKHHRITERGSDRLKFAFQLFGVISRIVSSQRILNLATRAILPKTLQDEQIIVVKSIHAEHV